MDSGRSLRVEGKARLGWGEGETLKPPSHPRSLGEHSAPSSRGGLRMARGHDGPAARRMWNHHHLWGRLRDFYQVRHRADQTGGPAAPREGDFLSVGLF